MRKALSGVASRAACRPRSEERVRASDAERDRGRPDALDRVTLAGHDPEQEVQVSAVRPECTTRSIPTVAGY
jgi:hypothetical protein